MSGSGNCFVIRESLKFIFYFRLPPSVYGAFAAALLIFAPGRKAGTFFAGISSAAPVLGFLPFRRVAKHPRGYSAPIKLYVRLSPHTAFTFQSENRRVISALLLSSEWLSWLRLFFFSPSHCGIDVALSPSLSYQLRFLPLPLVSYQM